MAKREVDLRDYDKAQAEAAQLLDKRYKQGFVPGLDGLVNELSKVTSGNEANQVIIGWDSGKPVKLPNPTIQSPDDGY